MQRPQNAEFAARADSAFLFNRPLGELISQEEKRSRANPADAEQEEHVLDEVRVNHQGDAAKHRLPKTHAFAVGERDKTDRTENKTGDQIRGIKLRHADRSS
jgi:hypothetical protein